MNLNISTLPDDPAFLKKILTEFKAHHDKETDLLLEQIRHLRNKIFGRKSEQLGNHAKSPQLPLFDLPEPAEEESAEIDPENIQIPAHTRKKSGRKPLPEKLPRVEVVHDIPEEEKICVCGCELTRIGEEISEQLDIIPARMQVIRNIRPKYACKKCEGVDHDGPTVKIAPVPPQIVPKSIATAALLAYVLTNKYVDALPFYRQEKLFSRIGIELSRATMCNWAMKTAESCRSLYNLLQEEVLLRPLVNADETTVQVLHEKGRDPTTKSYMWIFRGEDATKPVLIYQYHPTRSGDVAKVFLREYKGCVLTDGYNGFDFLEHQPGISHAGCWAHARRKFMDVIKAQGKNRQKTGSADKALGYIRKLYAIEKEADGCNLDHDATCLLRQEKSKPILDDFKLWLLKKTSQTPPKGLLGQAVSYTLKQWDRLVVYLDNGHVPMDNNAAENSIRPFVVGRKNWLFSGTAEGAEASAMLYSLIETAKANRLEPYAYLRYIFEKIPVANTLDDLEALFPWNLSQRILLAAMSKGVVD